MLSMILSSIPIHHIHSPSNEDVKRESTRRRKIEHEVWEMFPHIYMKKISRFMWQNM